MTEVPEHLLKRSRERRAAIGRRRGDAAASGAPARPRRPRPTPARRRRAAPAAAAPRPSSPRSPRPRRPPPHVQAALAATQDPVLGDARAGVAPAAVGLRLRRHPRAAAARRATTRWSLARSSTASCASCHGGGGGGGVGPALDRRCGLETSPDCADHDEVGRLGSTDWPAEVGDDLRRPATQPVAGGMPACGATSPAEELRRSSTTSAPSSASPDASPRPTCARRASGETSTVDRRRGRPAELASDATRRPRRDHRRGARARWPWMAARPMRRRDARRARRRRRAGGRGGGYWLAEAGHDVVRRRAQDVPPREDLRRRPDAAGGQPARDMGLEDRLGAATTATTGCGPWPTASPSSCSGPSTRSIPRYGYVVAAATSTRWSPSTPCSAGATLRTRAPRRVGPLLRDGLVAGAVVKDKETGETEEVRARYVVWPTARTPASVGRSAPRRGPRLPAGHGDPRLLREPAARRPVDRERARRARPQRQLAARATDGSSRWATGRSTSASACCRPSATSRASTPPTCMDEWAATAPDALGDRPRDATWASPPVGGCRWPARSDPKVGPNWIVVGDAAGSINPFNGEGIDYAYETGRMAAGLLDEALATGDGLALQRYPQMLDDEYGLYFKVARAVRQGDRPAGADAGADPGRHAVAAPSWSGCCGSWPTCSATTSSARPRPRTAPSPPSPASSPEKQAV